MKRFFLTAAALAAALALAGCPDPNGPDTAPTVITAAAIAGITVPVTGETPVTAVTPTGQYTGTVVWNPADAPFKANTAYTATITLTAATDYTLQGVTANFFQVAGAATMTNPANSGVVTAVFPKTNTGTDPDFTDHKSSYSILVRNYTNERLVAFKSGLSAKNMIGGIPANSGAAHGLPLNTALFTASQDFPLLLITEEQYNAHKSNLQAIKEQLFGSIYTFYNAEGENENPFEISDRLGGANTILLQNMTKMNVELRLNGVHGPTLGYAQAETLNTKLFVQTGDYLIFPVFKLFDSRKNKITTVYPRRQSGLPWYKQTQLGHNGQTELSLDVQAVLSEQANLSTGTAWLIIDNQLSDTGIQLQKGDAIQRTPEGIATINNGFSRTYEVDMAQITGGTDNGKYAQSANIGAYVVGPTGNTKPIGNYDLSVDKVYKVTVTGDFDHMVISAPVEQGSVDLTDFPSE